MKANRAVLKWTEPLFKGGVGVGDGRVWFAGLGYDVSRGSGVCFALIVEKSGELLSESSLRVANFRLNCIDAKDAQWHVVSSKY